MPKSNARDKLKSLHPDDPYPSIQNQQSRWAKVLSCLKFDKTHYNNHNLITVARIGIHF